MIMHINLMEIKLQDTILKKNNFKIIIYDNIMMKIHNINIDKIIDILMYHQEFIKNIYTNLLRDHLDTQNEEENYVNNLYDQFIQMFHELKKCNYTQEDKIKFYPKILLNRKIFYNIFTQDFSNKQNKLIIQKIYKILNKIKKNFDQNIFITNQHKFEFINDDNFNIDSDMISQCFHQEKCHSPNEIILEINDVFNNMYIEKINNINDSMYIIKSKMMILENKLNLLLLNHQDEHLLKNIHQEMDNLVNYTNTKIHENANILIIQINQKKIHPKIIEEEGNFFYVTFNFETNEVE